MKGSAAVAGALLGGLALYAGFLLLGRDARRAAASPELAGETAIPRTVAPLVPAHRPAEEETPARAVETAPAAAEHEAAIPASTAADDPVGCVVYGHVLDEEGAVLAADDVTVSLFDSTGKRVLARADAAGRYSLAGLSPGPWRLNAWATHHRNEVEHVELAAGSPPLEVDFVLRPEPILRVRVVAPDGRPFQEAAREAGVSSSELLPVATREPPGATFDEVVGSYNNTFGVGSFWQNGYNGPKLPPAYVGILVLHEDPPVHVSLVHYSAVLETKRVEPGTDEVTFELDPERLRAGLAGLEVRVVRADTGEPVSGCQVTLNDARSWRPGVALDAEGRARFEGKPPGPYDLRATLPGLERLHRKVDLEPGRVLDLGTIALGPGRWIEARVVGPDGEPAQARFVLGESEDGTGKVSFDWSSLRASDEQGRLRIDGLGAGDYLLRSEEPDEDGSPDAQSAVTSRVIEVSTTAGSVEDLVIRLERVRVLALEPAPGLEEKWTFRLRDEAGHLCRWGSVTNAWGRRLLLPPGSYELTLRGPAGEESRRPVALTEDLTMTVGP